MEEVDSCDIFECPVCMEFLIDKQPRLLHCGHTFCTPCLKQMAKRKVYIVCPKCRSKTTFSHGVESLAKNIDLSKMMEIQLKNEVKCQMCRNHFGVEYACTKCKKQLICKFCAKRHKKVPTLRSHKLWPIPSLQEDTDSEQNMMKQEKCKFHNEELSYYCDVCQKVLCTVGICKPIHDNHNENIGNVREAINYLEEKVKSKKEQLNDITKPELISAQHVIIGELNMVQAAKHKLIMAKLNLSRKELNKDEASLKVIESEISINGKAVQKLNMEVDLVLNKHRNRDYIYELTNFNKTAEKQLDAVKQLMEQTFTSLQYLTYQTSANGDLQIVRSKKSLAGIIKQEMAKTPDLALHLNVNNDIVKTKQSLTVHEVLGLWDGSIILVIGSKTYLVFGYELDGTNEAFGYLVRIDAKGTIVRKYGYPLKGHNKKLSACACEENLFLLYESDISRVNLELDGPMKITTVLTMVNIAHIVALYSNILILSQSGENSGVKIYQYNIDHRRLVVKVSNIINPGKVCVVPCGKNTKFVVTCRGQNDMVSPNIQVHIYDSTWTLVTIIDTINSHLISPTVTPCGTLLFIEKQIHLGSRYFSAREYNRIVCYDLEGNFKQDLFECKLHLGGSEDTSNESIAYSSPYLFISESVDHSQMLTVLVVDDVPIVGFKPLSQFKVKLKNYCETLLLFSVIMLIYLLYKYM